MHHKPHGKYHHSRTKIIHEVHLFPFRFFCYLLFRVHRGVTLNYVKTMPNVAIYMSIYDVIKHFLESLEE